MSLHIDIGAAAEALLVEARLAPDERLRERLGEVREQVLDLRVGATELSSELKYALQDLEDARSEIRDLEDQVGDLTAWSNDDVAVSTAYGAPDEAARSGRETVETLRRSCGQSGAGGMLADLIETLVDQLEEARHG